LILFTTVVNDAGPLTYSIKWIACGMHLIAINLGYISQNSLNGECKDRSTYRAYEYGAELQTSRLHNCMTQYCFAHVQARVAWKEQI
jgi:hypothetical protein